MLALFFLNKTLQDAPLLLKACIGLLSLATAELKFQMIEHIDTAMMNGAEHFFFRVGDEIQAIAGLDLEGATWQIEKGNGKLVSQHISKEGKVTYHHILRWKGILQ